VVRGGGLVPGQDLLIEPMVILDAPPDSRVMTEEIFGPVLPDHASGAKKDVSRPSSLLLGNDEMG
jgi:hypothetical protein